jgi:hypothetical protein
MTVANSNYDRIALALHTNESIPPTVLGFYGKLQAVDVEPTVATTASAQRSDVSDNARVLRRKKVSDLSSCSRSTSNRMCVWLDLRKEQAKAKQSKARICATQAEARSSSPAAARSILATATWQRLGMDLRSIPRPSASTTSSLLPVHTTQAAAHLPYPHHTALHALVRTGKLQRSFHGPY